jgi:hypothetical protein
VGDVEVSHLTKLDEALFEHMLVTKPFVTNLEKHHILTELEKHDLFIHFADFLPHCLNVHNSPVFLYGDGVSPSLSSAGTKTPFSSNNFAKLPSWCIDMRISVPPMNSLSTYN